MKSIKDTIAGDEITFYFVQSRSDCADVMDFVNDREWLALDTESSRLNCYHPDWFMRTFQVGDAFESFVVPAQLRKLIGRVMASDTKWIGHNGTHDIRCIDVHLGYNTGVECIGETYLASHNQDSRNKPEGGVGHGLKDQAVSFVDRSAGKWEKALKEEFKKIYVPIPGQVYKSGPRKGTQKMRKIKLSEGWEHISLDNPVYWAYAGSDPVLTYRRWEQLKPYARSIMPLYKFDREVDLACDELQRRAVLLDVPYTQKLSNAYERKAASLQKRLDTFRKNGVNINSTAQLAEVLLDLDVKLTAKTDTGKWKINGDVLRKIRDDPYTNGKVREFIRLVLLAKQITKRRASYAEAMLRERDINDRIHASINSQAARTFRMSVSNPAFQQLPTKDREDEEDWEMEEEDLNE